MTKGIIGREPDPEIVYADIFRLPRHRSAKHPPMSLYDRAAQFAPFAALTGYEDMIEEEARQTEARIELGEEARERLNTELTRAAETLAEGRRPVYTITYFVQDPLKEGGAYVTVTEEIRRIDTVRRQLELSRREGYGGSYVRIPTDDILEMTEG